MKKIYIHSDYQQCPDILAFVGELPSIFNQGCDIIFNGRNTIKRFVVGDICLAVKRFRKPSLLQRVIYTFFRSNKAIKSFRNAVELSNREVETPSPIACVEEYGHGLFKYGYYLCLNVMQNDIKEKLIDQVPFDASMAQSFAKFVAVLHEKGILHHDLNPTNVLYRKIGEGESYSFSLIDINRMSFYSASGSISMKDCFENLTRFTGKMELFQYVAGHYISFRGWNKDLIDLALAIKIKHDKAWRRRKDFLSKFKKK